MSTISVLLVIVILLLCVARFPLAWYRSQKREADRRTRIRLGVMAILSAAAVGVIMSLIWQVSYDHCYGGASKVLLDAGISQLQAGNTEHVLKVFKQVQADYEPTYMHRARYGEIAKRAAADMKSPPSTSGEEGRGGGSMPAAD